MKTTIVGMHGKIFSGEESELSILHRLEKTGLDILVGNQSHKSDALSYFMKYLTGVDQHASKSYFETNTDYIQYEITGELRCNSTVTVEDYNDLSQQLNSDIKAALPGPYSLAKLSKDNFYDNIHKRTEAFARCLNTEMRALQQAGCLRIAINEPALVQIDYREDNSAFFDTLPLLLSGINIETALYTYFGVIGGIHEKIYSSPFNIIGLDFVINERNWDFLMEFPEDKTLSFGIVDALNPELESEEDLTDAIEMVAEMIPSERVIINPQCEIGFIPMEVSLSKIEQMVRKVNDFNS
ncbi:MAG: hypothetical protein GF315_09005 [candidate division Zixibacteria bacterium]|nr:hypothetical protein [candidate division Zixibacteria bacterium]